MPINFQLVEAVETRENMKCAIRDRGESLEEGIKRLCCVIKRSYIIKIYDLVDTRRAPNPKSFLDRGARWGLDVYVFIWRDREGREGGEETLKYMESNHVASFFSPQLLRIL